MEEELFSWGETYEDAKDIPEVEERFLETVIVEYTKHLKSKGIELNEGALECAILEYHHHSRDYVALGIELANGDYLDMELYWNHNQAYILGTADIWRWKDEEE